MGNRFLQKIILTCLLLLAIAVQVNAASRKYYLLPTGQASTETKFSATLGETGEIELPAIQSFTGYPQHVTVRKAMFPLWNAYSEHVYQQKSFVLLTSHSKNSPQSTHLILIFPFHYFW